MKNRLVVLGLLSILLTLGAMAQGITMTMPSVPTPAPNATVSIPINVANFNNVGAISLEITYNTAIMTYNNFSNAPSGFTVNELTPGVIRLGWFDGTGNTPLTVSTKLLDLNFTYMSGTDSYVFNTSNCEIANGVGTVLSVSYQGGSIYIPQTYTLTYTAGPNGTISGTSPQIIISGGNGTPVTAVPNTGYHFVNWSDSVTSATRQDGSVTANKSVTANFAINTYTLTYTAGANGTISGTSSQTVNYGSSGTPVTAVPNTGYYFIQWSDGSTSNPRTDNNVTANKSVTANFEINTYTLTYTAGANGTISGTSSQTVNYGASGTAVTANPNTGYHFIQWSDGSTSNPRTDNNVTANKNVTATFAINTYTLTYTAGANGTISGTSSQTVNYGASGTAVTANPNTGYHFIQWSDGSTSNPRTDNNVTANKSVTASFATIDYTIIVPICIGGTLTPGTTIVNYGGSLTFSITPNPNYHLVDVMVDGLSVGAVSSYTFSNVTSNHTITAYFAINTYTLNYTAGANGAISGTSSQTVNYGASGTAVTANPNTGYYFIQWSDGSTSNPRTDNNVTANKSVTASFAINNYLITVSPGSGGSISPGTTSVNYGGSQTFSITPNTGYHISGVNVDGGTAVGAVSSYTFSNVTFAHMITAYFTPNTYTISASASSGGSISPGTTTVSYGGSQTFSITPNTGYHIVSVMVNGSNVGAVSSYTFNNVTSSQSITANFDYNTYTITVSPGSGGSISPGTTTVSYGGSQTFSITPNTGYHISGVNVDGGTAVGAVSSYTFSNVTFAHMITAYFTPNTYTISASASSGGSISPGSANVGYGGSQTFSITPNTGYHIASVMVNGSNVGAVSSYTFNNVTSSQSITANFTPNTYTISASASSGGSISPGTTTVSYGGSQTFSITPNTGYHIASVMVNGSNVGAVSSYTFNNVTSNQSITANFDYNTYTITVSPGSGGSISPGTTTVSYGGSQTFSITPNAGYQISNVTIDGGTSVGAVSSYTFSNVTFAHMISAYFTPNTYTISGHVSFMGFALVGVTMDGLPGSPSTNSSGNYAATVSYGWSGTVTPTLDWFSFSPGSTTYSPVNSDITTNYTGAYGKRAANQFVELPREFAILQNVPNPFNPTTEIRYQLPAASLVKLVVYDVMGREVAILAEGMRNPGYYTSTFNGSRFTSGIYFARLTAIPQDGDRPFIKVMKMLMVK